MCIDPNGKKRAARGFTLLEVAIGVTILAVLAGTMFSIVQGSLRAAGELRMVQRDNHRLDRFITVMRESFRMLPPDATMELRLIETSPVIQEIVFRWAPGMFVWGERPIDPQAFTLAMRRYPEALLTPEAPEFYLAMSRPDFFRPEPEEGAREILMNVAMTYPLGERDLPVVADPQGRYWLPLAPAVRSLQWRFYDIKKKRWLDKSGPTRPPLVELVLQPFESNMPIRVVMATR